MKRSKDEIRKIMQSVKSSGSKIEIALRKSLWNKGYKYRKNVKNIFGKPDIVFKNIKLAIFVDSEFWHGKNWTITKNDHKSNLEYWHKKIESNILRDILVNKTLKKQGWKVLRFWGTDIQRNLNKCINKIEKTIEIRKTI